MGVSIVPKFWVGSQKDAKNLGNRCSARLGLDGLRGTVLQPAPPCKVRFAGGQEISTGAVWRERQVNFADKIRQGAGTSKCNHFNGLRVLMWLPSRRRNQGVETRCILRSTTAFTDFEPGQK